MRIPDLTQINYPRRVTQPTWNEHYAAGTPPWESGTPDESLVEAVRSGLVKPGRTLDVGCGTGTNALFLAEHGFEVLGVDISPLAIEKARAKAGGRCRFEVRDFLASDTPGGPFDVVFDRGCWHVFDEAADRERFAARVAALLAPDGRWLSLIGSTEGAPREFGPPRRSARDIATAVEPVLEILELRMIHFDLERMEPPKAWLLLAQRREVPAQPSSRHSD
jgi:SAM-dependent methyltransferase